MYGERRRSIGNMEIRKKRNQFTKIEREKMEKAFDSFVLTLKKKERQQFLAKRENKIKQYQSLDSHNQKLSREKQVAKRKKKYEKVRNRYYKERNQKRKDEITNSKKRIEIMDELEQIEKEEMIRLEKEKYMYKKFMEKQLQKKIKDEQLRRLWNSKRRIKRMDDSDYLIQTEIEIREEAEKQRKERKLALTPKKKIRIRTPKKNARRLRKSFSSKTLKPKSHIRSNSVYSTLSSVGEGKFSSIYKDLDE